VSLLMTRVAAVAAGALAALAGGHPGASAGSLGGCPPAHAQVLARSPTARVFSLGGASPRIGSGSTAVYGCLVRGGNPIALAPGPFARSHVGPVKLAGDVVAYGFTLLGVDTAQGSVRVLDLAGLRRLHDLPATSPPRHPESFTNVTALVLTRAGAVAWIGQKGGIGQRPTFEVHRADRSGAALLDSGAAIAPGSLRLSGHSVSWRDHGRSSSARLG
jgi:hypothetical protein